MVKREGGGSRDRNDTVKFIEKERKEERERERGGGDEESRMKNYR